MVGAKVVSFILHVAEISFQLHLCLKIIWTCDIGNIIQIWTCDEGNMEFYASELTIFASVNIVDKDP